MRDLGDRAENATLDFTFHTTNASGVPTTLAGVPVVSVYKANGIVQTVIGVTLTVDFDGVTGLNHVRVVMTDAFYAVANDYTIVITTGRVSINEDYVLSSFPYGLEWQPDLAPQQIPYHTWNSTLWERGIHLSLYGSGSS